MTAPVKIHRRDPDNPKGVACGKTVDPTRVTDDPTLVTCVVCLTFAAENREALSTPPARRRSGTVIDRLAPTGNGKDPARDAALLALAGRHLDEFLELYRDELTEVGR